MNERDKARFLENKGKWITLIILAIIVILMGSVVIVYYNSSEFRVFMDNNILMKQVESKDAKVLQVFSLDQNSVIAFNGGIGILKNNQFDIYDSNLDRQEQLEIKITNAVHCNSSEFLVLGEENGQKIYLIKNKQILWEETIEGAIYSVCVNKNGYVAVLTIGTSHKTVITMFDQAGKKIFNTYLAKTLVTDVSMSSDNKYLAFAEVDASGAIVQSKVKEVSLEKINSNSENAIQNVYECEIGAMLTNIEYTDKGKIMCMYTNKITMLDGEEEVLLFDLGQMSPVFQSVNILNAAIVLEQYSTGVFSSETVLKILDGKGGENKTYEFENIITKIETSGDIIAGISNNVVEFVNTKGWLVKRYISSQEILNVVLCEDIAGIIFKDRIELIKL